MFNRCESEGVAGDNYLVSLTCNGSLLQEQNNIVNNIKNAERGKLLSIRRLPIDGVQQRAKFKKETGSARNRVWRNRYKGRGLSQ